MKEMKKALLAVAIIMLIVPLVAGMNLAEAASKPSVPEFTLNLQNDSNIQLVIENHPFTQSSAVNSLVYYYKVKDHYSETWMRCSNFQLQSNSTNTLITARLNTLFLLANATSLDFQVQTETGYYTITNKTGGPALMPSVQDWHTEITYEASETSDWSSTQTITMHGDSASASPTPTPTSNPAVTVSLSESASALNYGNTINFTVSVDGGIPPYTFAWYIDNQLTETSNSQYFSTDSQAVGSHHVYVQVTDANGYSATTLTVEFNVLPVISTSASLSPILSNSPTQQPTLEPSPTSHTYQGEDFTPKIIIYSLVASVVVIGLLAYFVKRKGWKTND
jgi:hypothetical protein